MSSRAESRDSHDRHVWSLSLDKLGMTFEEIVDYHEDRIMPELFVPSNRRPTLPGALLVDVAV